MSATAVVTNARMTDTRMSPLKIVLSWIGIALVAFPLAGLAGWGVGGHVDDVVPALSSVGRSRVRVSGSCNGCPQAGSRHESHWIVATSLALMVGLAVGSAVVDYDTSTGQLALMGAISGVPVGIAQGLLLRSRFSLWHIWMVSMPALFALGWVVSASIGVDVDNQFTVFGASIAFGLLTGLLMMAGKRIDDVQ